MINESWLCISALLLAAGIVVAALMVVCWLFNKKTPWLINGWVAMALVVGSALAYYLPINISTGGQGHEIVDEVISSVLEVGRVLQGENDLAYTRSKIDTSQLSEWWQRYFGVYTAVMHVAMSAALVGLIYKVVRRLFAESFISHIFRRKVYVFSTISERTLLLAEDIFGKEQGASLIFLNKNDSGKETDLYMMSRVESVRGKVLSEDPARLRLPRYYLALKKEIEFFLLDENETENCYQTFDLIRKYENTKRRIVVNLLVHSPEATILTSDNTRIPPESELIIRPLDEYSTIVHQLADTRPFFLGKRKDKDTGEDRLTILIVGAGSIGMAATKTASWCAHTLKLRPEILVVDSDPLAERRFAAECPELYANVDDEVSIKFFTRDITGDEFVRFAEEHPEIGYVIVSLGDDMLNLHVGKVLRTVFERHRLNDESADLDLPLINVKVRDRVFSKKMASITKDKEYGANMHNMHPFGSLDSIFRYDVITNRALDRGRMEVYKSYGYSYTSGSDDFKVYWRTTQYDRNSSMATALHTKYQAYSILEEELGKRCGNAEWMRPGVSQVLIEEVEAELKKRDTGERRPDGFTPFAKLEHRRWNSYMRSIGWSRATYEQIDLYYEQQLASGNAIDREASHKNFAARLHGCICPWEELDTLNKYIGRDDISDLRNSDYKNIEHLPDILRAIANTSANDDKGKY